MSYDLFFKPRSGDLDRKKVIEYFSSRPNYTADSSQIWYQNEDTGVHFVFEFQEGGEESDEYPIALNVNYFRPSFFGTEVELEISAFVRRFDLIVRDPQTNGMGEGEYVPELFHSGWNAGNEFGHAVILKNPSNRNGIASLSTSILMRSWHWNVHRKVLQSELGDNIFVPRIICLLVDGNPFIGLIWPDGIPIAAPEVDYLLVPRKELAPRRFFSKREDTTLLAWRDALPMLEKYSYQREDGLIVMNYATPPKEVQEYVKSLPATRSAITVLSADKVLDKELVERYVV